MGVLCSTVFPNLGQSNSWNSGTNGTDGTLGALGVGEKVHSVSCIPLFFPLLPIFPVHSPCFSRQTERNIPLLHPCRLFYPEFGKTVEYATPICSKWIRTSTLQSFTAPSAKLQKSYFNLCHTVKVDPQDGEQTVFPVTG